MVTDMHNVCHLSIFLEIYILILILCRSGTSNDWISPARYLKGQNGDQFQVTFNPSDMNSAGIIYFNETAAYLMSFVASRIKIQWVSGPTSLFFDFVGKN